MIAARIPYVRTDPARTHSPAQAATDLAHDMLGNGWTLSGATVRVIHTAYLADDSGLTIAVSSEAGKVRIEFDSEYRRLEGCSARRAWHAETARALPVEVLAAVASANTVASDDDPTDVGETLTAAGWSQPYPGERKWISPGGESEVAFIDEDLEDTPTPWVIRRRLERPITVYASTDAPAAVVTAFALTHVGQH